MATKMKVNMSMIDLTEKRTRTIFLLLFLGFIILFVGCKHRESTSTVLRDKSFYVEEISDELFAFAFMVASNMTGVPIMRDE